MRQALYTYPLVILFLVGTTRLGPNVWLTLYYPIASVVATYRSDHNLLRHSDEIAVREEDDTATTGSSIQTVRRRLISTKFLSDYPPIALSPSISQQRHSTNEKHFLSARVDNNNTETCTASCCAENYYSSYISSSTYNNHKNQYQEVVPSCPICTECVSGNPLAFLPTWIQYVAMLVLLSFSGLFAGLTLGFLSLDKTGLEVLMESDDSKTASYARKIYPIRLKGNLLLCTLLLGNTAANSLGSILIADLFGGVVGAVVSTIVILIFGEIAPQAVCSRYALFIGSHAVPIVKVIICIFYPVAKPLAMTLDYALGDELAMTYSSKELIKLLQIHVDQNMLDHDTANTMTGALNYKNLPVRDVMTPLNNVYMLKMDDKLNFETIAKIFKAGYSRIPVYEVSPNNVVGLLFVKDLIFIDPEDETAVADFIEIFGRGVHVVWPDDKLGDVLVELKRGRSHMALVRDVQDDGNTDPFYKTLGIITLEDIIEEILGQEIVDETDAFVDGSHTEKLDREDVFNFARLRLLNSKIVDGKLSTEETSVVTAHLRSNYSSIFSGLSESQLHRLVSDTPISVFPTAAQDFGTNVPQEDLIYVKGEPIDVCTLILSGKVSVLVGVDQFRSDVSSWTLLAAGALENVNYVPDFSAFVSTGPCRCIRISRSRFTSALDTTILERTELNRISAAQSTSQSEASPSFGQGTSRKTKLVTALQAAIDGDASRQKDKSTKLAKTTSTVAFADPGTLRRSSSAKLKSSASSSTKAKPTLQATPSRFGFISAPSKMFANEEGDSNDQTK